MMNIFNDLRKHQESQSHLRYSPKTEEVKEEKNLWGKMKEIDWTMPLFTLVILIISGLVWYIWSVEFFGMVFFGIISFLIFCIFTPGGAHLSTILEKKFGDKIMPVGCLIMLLGPILAVTVFVSSIEYWDLKKHYEYHDVKVYITPYGECYHKSYNCYTIKGHEINSTSKSRALDLGRRPCEICTSPTYDD
jgi:hypothetical protein